MSAESPLEGGCFSDLLLHNKSPENQGHQTTATSFCLWSLRGESREGTTRSRGPRLCSAVMLTRASTPGFSMWLALLPHKTSDLHQSTGSSSDRASMAFYEPTLKVIQHHFLYTLLTEAVIGPLKFPGRGLRHHPEGRNAGVCCHAFKPPQECWGRKESSCMKKVGHGRLRERAEESEQVRNRGWPPW